MSEKFGSEIERLWFRMTPSSMDCGSIKKFKFRVVLCRIRLFPTLISKKWFGSELPFNATWRSFWPLKLVFLTDCFLWFSFTWPFSIVNDRPIWFDSKRDHLSRLIRHWLWIHPFRAFKLDLVHTVLILGDFNPISQRNFSSWNNIEGLLILVQTNCEFVWISPNHRGRGFCICGNFTGKEIVLKELEDVQTTFRGTYLIFWFLLSHAFQVFDATFKRF